MSDDPMLPEVVAWAVRPGRTSPVEHGGSRGEHPMLYLRWIDLCGVVGEETFFRAASSRVRADQPGAADPRRPAAASGPDPEGEYGTQVVELDFDEVLRDALEGKNPPGPTSRP